MLLEICEYVHGLTLVPVGMEAHSLREHVLAPPGTHQCCSMEIPVCFGRRLNMVGRLWWALSIVALSITHVSVSVANNFVRPQSSADYGYYAYGEVSHFVYCLLQKIKQSSVFPLVERWEEYMTPNHSQFAAIEEDRFLAGTRVLSALEKVGSPYLKKEFRRDCRKFLEEFVSCVLSTVAARSAIGQGLSCFCPSVLIGGDDHAPLQLFDLFLDGLLAKGWVKGSDMEACKSEYQSLVQEQRLLERTSTRGRPDVGNVLTFLSSQAGFRVQSHLYKVCIGLHKVGSNLAAFSVHSCVVSGLSINGSCPTWSITFWREVHCGIGSGCHT